MFLHFGVNIQDGGSSPSWIFGVPYGFFEKPVCDRSSKLLSFWENRVFAFWRQNPWWRIFAIFDFRGSITGSLKSPGTTSYRLSIDIIAINCLVFEKIAFLCMLATDLRGVYNDTTQLNSTSSCQVHSVNNCHRSVLNVVTQLTQFVGHDVIYDAVASRRLR